MNSLNSKTTRSSEYKVLVFDLDDTLIDTTNTLVPEASKKACEAMIRLGLNCDLKTCIQTRTDLVSQYSKFELFDVLVEKINGNKNMAIAKSGFELFYNPEIPAHIQTLNQADTIIPLLSQKYILFILTSGMPSTQIQKINLLSFKNHFKNFFFCDISKNEVKKKYLQDILDSENILPQQLLCIGNRYDDEISAALELNCHTCWIPYGEHDKKVTIKSKSIYQCQSINDLIGTCNL